MRKALAFFLLLALFCFTGRGAILYAQGDSPGYSESTPDDDDDDGQTEVDMSGYIPDMYARGDQIVTISLGTIFPAVFVNNGSVISHNIKPPVGFALSLAYSYFWGSNLFFGIEVGFKSAFTLGENSLYIIPIGIRAGWQFVYRRFEFPLYAAIGVAPQRYLDNGYFGMYLKGAAGAYFRFNPKWSFGISTDWSWYPQWTMKDGRRTPDKDVDANIIGVLLSARYHF